MHWSWFCEPTAYSRGIPLWIFCAWIDCGPCWAKLMEHGQSSGFHSNSTHLIRSCTSGVASAGSREHGQIKALPGLPPTSSFFLCPSLSNCYTLRNYLYQIISTVMIISQFRQPMITRLARISNALIMQTTPEFSITDYWNWINLGCFMIIKCREWTYRWLFSYTMCILWIFSSVLTPRRALPRRSPLSWRQ